jgi:hypothetical protein
MFPNADGGFLNLANFRYRALKPLREALELPKLNFLGAPADDRYQSTETGVGEECSIAPASLTSGHHRKRVHAGASGEFGADGRNGLRDAHVDGNRAAVAKVGLSRYNRRS